MRNLKKILALALALVMSMSLMATANAFTDDDSINDTYETAVTVLSGLKVFQGYDDGSFLPQGAITRAEVAAIIYRIVTGDVADTQVGIYADYNKFDDVASTSWYAGYVNFCANAEYIKGYDARTFGPNDPVTGYQALAMILRALGYDKNNEFTGTNWQVQTAAVGEQRGITKNITAGTLGVPATREVVAEILFQAILVPTVIYTPAFGYTIGDTSLGYKTFGLEDIVGVVVANEYADLYGASPMDEGETELDVDGESYVIDYATTLEDIGEAQHAYVAGSTVLAIADAGNTVFETGAATDIGSDSDFEDVTSLERDDETEYFLNFDGGDSYKASDWRIKYVVKFANGNATVDFEKAYGIDIETIMDETSAGSNEFEKVIKAGNTITNDDLTIIKAIFNDADRLEDDSTYVVGEVYVGTQSTTDISDEFSYNQFKDKYIETAENGVDFEDTDNGEWLKVIDNDGDGVADIVLKTEFVMSYIDRISKSGKYTLADLSKDDAAAFNDVEIDGADIVTEDELAENDVVIYTKIDGKYYMNIAEMVTETVDKKGINSRTETMTCNGTDYVQSHISFGGTDIYYDDVTDAHTERTYDLYLDHFGYVRLFVESDYNTFMLLTDGYYENDRQNWTFQAEYWNVEAAEKQKIDVVDDGDVDEFIKSGAVGNEGTWDNLWGTGWTYLNYAADNDPFITNIAGYSEGDDGYTLKNAEHSTGRMQYEVQELDLTGVDLDERTIYSNDADENCIQTTTDTQYYLVIKGYDIRNRVDYVEDVITWTGYANAPEDAELVNAAAYAVTHETDTTGGNYYVADVVVFESDAYADRDTFLVYDANNYWNVEYVWGIGYDAEGKIADDRIDVDKAWYDYLDETDIEFYEINENAEVLRHITENFAADHIYAGHVTTAYDVSGRDYIRVSDTMYGTKGDLYIYPETAPIYTIEEKSNGERTASAETDWDEIANGDHMILFTDKDGNVEYAIWVEGSLYAYDADNDGKKNDVIDELYNLTDTTGDGLWNDIYNDARYVEYDVTVNNYFPAGLEYDLYNAAGDKVSPISSTGTVDGNGKQYVYDSYSLVPGIYTMEVTEIDGYVPFDYYVANNKAQLAGTVNADGNMEYTIVVNSDSIVEITADSVLETFSVTEDATTSGSDNATVKNLPADKVDYGTQVTFEVEADFGYAVTKVTATDANGAVDVKDNGDGTYTTEAITADTEIAVETKAEDVALEILSYNADGALISDGIVRVTVPFDTKNYAVELSGLADYKYTTGDKKEIGETGANMTLDFTKDYVSLNADGTYSMNIRIDYIDEATIRVVKGIDDANWNFAGAPLTIEAAGDTVTITPTHSGWGASQDRWFTIEVDGATPDEAVFKLDNNTSTTFDVELSNLTKSTVTITIVAVDNTDPTLVP